MLTGISTQGHHSNNEYVSKYRLDYSVDGSAWFTYTQSFGNPGNRIVDLAANTDSSSVFKNKFLYEINARFLKIVVKDWHSSICLRVQVFGYKGKTNLMPKYFAAVLAVASLHSGLILFSIQNVILRHPGMFCSQINCDRRGLKIFLSRARIPREKLCLLICILTLDLYFECGLVGIFVGFELNFFRSSCTENQKRFLDFFRLQ